MSRIMTVKHGRFGFGGMAPWLVPAYIKKMSTPTNKSSKHPTYLEMISAAITTLNDRRGSSRQAISKFVCDIYKIDAREAAPHLRRALKKGLEVGVLKTAKESGKGSGSYKIVKNKKKPAAKKVKTSTKSMAFTKESGIASGNA